MAHNDAVKPRPSFFEIHLPLPCAGGPWAERAEGSKQQPESSEFRLSEISFIGISPPIPHTHLFFFFWEEAFFFPLCFVYGASLLSHSWKFNLLHLCAALKVNLTRVVREWRKGRNTWSHRQSGLSGGKAEAPQKSVYLLCTVEWGQMLFHTDKPRRQVYLISVGMVSEGNTL